MDNQPVEIQPLGEGAEPRPTLAALIGQQPSIREPERLIPPPNSQVVSAGYLVTAVIFFALGFLLAVFLGLNDNPSNSAPGSAEIAQGVQATLIALTPPPTLTPTAVPVELTYSEEDYVLGPDDAPITLVEFSDYRCPYCGRFAAETLKPLLAQYDGLIRFVYRDFPIFGDVSIRAAHAAQCAGRQGKFWEYHDAIFASQAQPERLALIDADLMDFALELDLDTDAFIACLADNSIAERIVQRFAEAEYMLGQAGTPTFLINGKRYTGAQPLPYFVEVINAELALLGVTQP